jgi:hypothetical protein
MKKSIRKIINAAILFWAAMLGSIYSFAQVASDEPTSIYDDKSGGKSVMYNGILPYVIFGAVIVLLGYLGYRYWHDNAQEL